MNTTTNTRGVSEAMPNDDTGHEFAKRHGLFIYEVDFGDEGKGRYIRLSDFNRVVAALSAEPAAQGEGCPNCGAPCVKQRVWDEAGGYHTYQYTAPPAQRVPEELKELANEMEACWVCASNGDGEITLETINNWAGRLALLAASPAPSPARGDGGEG